MGGKRLGNIRAVHWLSRPIPPGPGRPRIWLLALGAAVLVAVAAQAGCSGASTGGQTALTRDQRWRQDVAYLAAKLPQVHVNGLLQVPATSWNAAAARLEAEVPRLSDGQVIVGMARMVAMLHDDETVVTWPANSQFPFNLTWADGNLYLVSVPNGDRDLLGAQIVEVGGHPIAQVLSEIGSVIDYQGPVLHEDEEADYLTYHPSLLNWLGLTPSPSEATFTVQTVSGARAMLRLKAATALRANALASVPAPLYMRDQDKPYWMQILASQHAVYVKYNQCLDDNGFQQLAAQALAILRERPAYRLIVDLRDNSGGDTAPFTSLIDGLTADPALRRPDRVFGLVNRYTDSSATLDANMLAQVPNAVLIGQEPGDPIDEYGDESSFTLPNSDVQVIYTTAIVNGTGKLLAAPDIDVAPTIQQLLAGTDPVLQAALSYHS